jgi:lycopene cyclase domain-containing protein
MFFKFEYLIVLSIIVIPTLLLSTLHKNSPLKGKFKVLFFSILISSLPFLIWDVYATYQGHWQFNPKFNLGIYLLNLPLEEVLFFFTVPFSCLFLWSEIKLFSSWKAFLTRL